MTRVRYAGGPLDGLNQDLGRELKPGQWLAHNADVAGWTGRCLYLALGNTEPAIEPLTVQFRGILCACIVLSPRGVSALCGLLAGHHGNCYGHVEIKTGG